MICKKLVGKWVVKVRIVFTLFPMHVGHKEKRHLKLDASFMIQFDKNLKFQIFKQLFD